MCSKLIAVLLSLSVAWCQAIDPIDEQLRRVEAMAGDEYPLFGIQTRFAAVVLLTPKHPARAHALLDRANAVLPSIDHVENRSRLLSKAIELMAGLNLKDAEELIRRFPQKARSGSDYTADAYDVLIRRDKGNMQALTARAFAAGAFRLQTAGERMLELVKTNPAEAVAFYAQILAAFPADAVEDDGLYLGNLGMHVLPAAPELAIEGAQKAVRAGWMIDREALASVKAIDADFEKRNRGYLDRKPAPAKRTIEDPDMFSEETDRVGSLPLAFALEAARKLAPPVKTGALLKISRREDLTARQQTAVAIEALAAAETMGPTDPNRLFAYSMLTRDFTKHGDHMNANRAVSLLADTFNRVCQGDAGYECPEMVRDFVTYMEEEGLTADDLNLHHPSLDAQFELRKLAKLLR